ncbi:MAG: endonuclease III [Oscillospiraceae bacterium]|nr:endonuclease III [Oscillospiraceae bacterium]
MTKQERALEAIRRLEDRYPDAICSLVYDRPYELLISTRLAAQCTDARVNIVTEELFGKYTSLQALADAELADIEAIVKPCGLFHTKAKDIIAMCRMLIDVYGGELPDTLEELTKLPGIGRKTANLVVGDIFHKPAVVTDTHCIRICGKLGLTEGKDPYKVEMALWQILPHEKANDFCHRLVLFGRDVCTARSPKCEGCPLKDICLAGGGE